MARPFRGGIGAIVRRAVEVGRHADLAQLVDLVLHERISGVTTTSGAVKQERRDRRPTCRCPWA